MVKHQVIHFFDITLLFGQLIFFKNLQFIILFLCKLTLKFYHFRLKRVINILVLADTDIEHMLNFLECTLCFKLAHNHRLRKGNHTFILHN